MAVWPDTGIAWDMHLAQLWGKAKGPMTGQGRENSGKADGTGKISQSFHSLDELQHNFSAAIAPHREDIHREDIGAYDLRDLDAFLKRPGIWRRGCFLLERIIDRLADDWRRDNEFGNASFLWTALAFALGAGSYVSLPDEPNLLMLCLVVVVLGVIGVRRLHKGAHAFSVLLGAMAFAGLLFASIHGQIFASPVLQAPVSTKITGHLIRIEYRQKDERWLVEVEAIDKLNASNQPRYVLLTRKNLEGRYHVGERLEMRARLTPLAQSVYPGGFDYGRYLWARGIGAQGYLGKSIRRLEKRESQSFLASGRNLVERLRQSIADSLMQRLDKEVAALSVTLSVGKRDYLTEDVKEALRQSGLAHILAISGMHMAVVAMAVLGALRAVLALSSGLVLQYPIKKWAAIGALLVATCYLFLSGWAVSTIRAYVMIAIFLGAIVIGRPALTLHNLALAMLVLVIWQPYAVVEAGFQMSFAATAALIAVYARLSRWKDFKEVPRSNIKLSLRKVAQWGGGIGITALVAGIAVLPFSLAHFQQVAPLSLLANFLAMPVFTLIVVPMALISLLFVPLGLQSLPLEGLGWGLETIIAIARLVSALSPEQMMIAPGHWALPLLAVLALSFFVIHRGFLAFVGVAFASFLLPLIWFGKPPDIWVSQKGTLAALRDDAGMWQFVGKSRSSFEMLQLLRSEGDVRALADTGSVKPVGSCGRAGCRYEIYSQQNQREKYLRLAIVRHSSAFSEDCLRSDLIVTPLPIPAFCKARVVVIDQAVLAQGGAYFGWLEEQSPSDQINTQSNGRSRRDIEMLSDSQKGSSGKWKIRFKPASTRGHRPWQKEALRP